MRNSTNCDQAWNILGWSLPKCKEREAKEKETLLPVDAQSVGKMFYLWQGGLCNSIAIVLNFLLHSILSLVISILTYLDLRLSTGLLGSLGESNTHSLHVHIHGIVGVSSIIIEISCFVGLLNKKSISYRTCVFCYMYYVSFEHMDDCKYFSIVVNWVCRIQETVVAEHTPFIGVMFCHFSHCTANHRYTLSQCCLPLVYGLFSS